MNNKIRKLKNQNKILLILSKCFYKIGINFPGRWLAYFRHKNIFKFIKPLSNDLINQNYNFNNLKTINNAPIFILWLQGKYDLMPEPVKLCYKSIQANCSNHEINLITEDNLSNYVSLPDYIIKKHSQGSISHAFFSDIVRATLLEKYGGIWIDATVFLSKTLPEEYFNQDFFSPCGFYGVNKQEWKYFFENSNGWCTWCMGTNKIHFPLFTFLRDFYFKYFEKYDTLIDYYLADFAFALFYRNNKTFRFYINNRKPNNQDPYSLANKMNKNFYKYKNQILSFLQDQIIHKLTYKRNWKKEINGKKTIYSYLLDIYNL